MNGSSHVLLCFMPLIINIFLLALMIDINLLRKSQRWPAVKCGRETERVSWSYCIDNNHRQG